MLKEEAIPISPFDGPEEADETDPLPRSTEENPKRAPKDLLFGAMLSQSMSPAFAAMLDSLPPIEPAPPYLPPFPSSTSSSPSSTSTSSTSSLPLPSTSSKQHPLLHPVEFSPTFSFLSFLLFWFYI